MLLVAGCAGPAGGLAGLIAAAVFGLGLLLHGCNADDCRDYEVCIDGEVTTRELCCPEGDECNYGLISMCSDGTCVDPFSDACPEDETGMDAGTDAGDDPDAGDDSDAGDDCAARQTVEVCVDREVVAAEICCPDGRSCDPLPVERCDDDSCVTGTQLCPEQCDGYVAQDCQGGVLIDVCCPMGVACNYGLGLEICDDGSCTYDQCPASCDEDAGTCAP